MEQGTGVLFLCGFLEDGCPSQKTKGHTEKRIKKADNVLKMFTRYRTKTSAILSRLGMS